MAGGFESSRPAPKAAASCRSSSLGSGGSAGSWMVLVCLSQCIFLYCAWILLLSSSLWLSRLPLCSTLHQSILCGVGGVKLSGGLHLQLVYLVSTLRVVTFNGGATSIAPEVRSGTRESRPE